MALLKQFAYYLANLKLNVYSDPFRVAQSDEKTFQQSARIMHRRTRTHLAVPTVLLKSITVESTIHRNTQAQRAANLLEIIAKATSWLTHQNALIQTIRSWLRLLLLFGTVTATLD